MRIARFLCGDFCFCLCLFLTSSSPLEAQEWPELPTRDGSVELPAQEWPMRPGPRSVRILMHFPGGDIQHVNADTGIMLTLHNWG